MAPRIQATKQTAATATKTESKDDTAFNLIVGEGQDIASFKAGDHLTNERVVDQFFRAHMIAGDDTAEDKLKNVSRAELIAVVRSQEVGDMLPADANAAILAALLDADFMLKGTEEIDAAKSDGSGALGYASKFGALAGKAFEEHWDKAIQGEKDKDAGPIITMLDLRALDAKHNGELLKNVPPIGSRYRNLKSDKAPYGYRLPGDTTPSNQHLPIYNGPWDYSKAYNTTLGKDMPVHWVSRFVYSTKTGKYHADMVDHCKAILNKGPMEDCPEELYAYADDDKNFDKVKISAVLDEHAFQYNKRVRITSRALLLIQKIDAAEARFKFTIDLVGVRDFDETPEQAARRRKPFCIVSQIPDAKRPGVVVERVHPQLQTAGRIANLEPKKHPGNAGPAAVFKVNRGTKGGAEKAKDQPGALAAEIKTTDTLEEYLSTIANYADKAENMEAIRKRMVSAENGGALASGIVSTYKFLQTLVTDNVLAMAKAHDDLAEIAVAGKMKQQVAEAKAKAA